MPGARTGLPGRELSTAGFAVMAAALRARERRMQAVAEGEPKLGRHRRVVLMPVGEEVPNVHTDIVDEPAHQPPPFSPAHSSMHRSRTTRVISAASISRGAVITTPC